MKCQAVITAGNSRRIDEDNPLRRSGNGRRVIPPLFAAELNMDITWNLQHDGASLFIIDKLTCASEFRRSVDKWNPGPELIGFVITKDLFRLIAAISCAIEGKIVPLLKV